MRNQKVRTKEGFFHPWHFVFISMGIAIFVFRFYIEISPRKIEYGYSRPLYPYIVKVLSLPGRLIPAPYSASELFVYAFVFTAVLWLAYHLCFLIRKKKSFLRLLLRLMIHGTALIAGACFFYLTAWGFNYLRQPFYISLNQGDAISPSASDYEELAYDMISFANTLHMPKDAHPLWETDYLVNSAMENIRITASLPRIPGFPPTKFLLSNECLNACGISGIFLPVFMEPHINSDLLPWERPWVMAHEKAHFMGFASETDANLIAYIACLSSASDMLRYSAALHILIALRSYFPGDSWRNMLKENLSPKAVQDINERSERIRRNQSRYARFFRISRKVNDTYLKMNSQTLGIRSYQAALPRLAVWWKKNSPESLLYKEGEITEHLKYF